MYPTLYLHGFLSTPVSNKARLLKKAHEERGIPFIAPELYMSPFEVAALIRKIRQEHGELNVIGSSLGGLYASWAMENLKLNRAVLLNPALGNWGPVGLESGWFDIEGTDKKMFVGEDFLDQVIEMLPSSFADQSKYLAVLSEKDEVLDWSVSRDLLSKAAQIVLPEGDHRISEFEPLVPPIMDFLADS